MEPGSQRVVVIAVLEGHPDPAAPEVAVFDLIIRDDQGAEEIVKVPRSSWRGVAPGDEMRLKYAGTDADPPYYTEIWELEISSATRAVELRQRTAPRWPR